MDIGLDGELTFHPDTIVKSCIFYWGGKYDSRYPYNSRGFREETEYKQIEFMDIPVRELNWIINEMRKSEITE